MSPQGTETEDRARRHELARFDGNCFRAGALLNHAAVIATNAGLGDIRVAKARAAAILAATLFHDIKGEADAADFRRLRDDLDLLIKAIDPLIEAIGAQAQDKCVGAREGEFKDCFNSVLGRATTDNAQHLLTRAAKACTDRLFVEA